MIYTMAPADRRVGWVGRAARGCAGTGLLAFAATQGLTGWDLAAAVTILPALSAGSAAIASRRSSRPVGNSQRWPRILGSVAVIAVVVGVGTAMTYASPVDAGAIYVFFGLSMVVAAIKGFSGCEILAIPLLVDRRHEALWCPLFSPVDSRTQTPPRPGHL